MTNIGTFSAFVLVAIGVLVLRRTQLTLRRAFRVPFVPVLPILFSLVLIVSLPGITIIRFIVWPASGPTVPLGICAHERHWGHTR